MLQVQKLCDEGDILEAIAEEMVLEKDRENLLWLIDRVILTDVVRYNRLINKVKSIELPDACGACGARVGEIHRYPMCAMEECPFCDRHSFQCDCVKRELKLTDYEKYTAETDYLPSDYYENGMSDEQYDQWMDLCEKKGRKPFLGNEDEHEKN